MLLQHKVPKLISAKGCKKVCQVNSGNKTQITILGCASAAGQVIPPIVVFTGKYFNPQLSDGEVHSLWDVAKWVDGSRAVF